MKARGNEKYREGIPVTSATMATTCLDIMLRYRYMLTFITEGVIQLCLDKCKIFTAIALTLLCLKPPSEDVALTSTIVLKRITK